MSLKVKCLDKISKDKISGGKTSKSKLSRGQISEGHMSKVHTFYGKMSRGENIQKVKYPKSQMYRSLTIVRASSKLLKMHSVFDRDYIE